MIGIPDNLIGIFRDEAREYIVAMRSALAAMESGQSEGLFTLLNEAFRCAHSLKGSARAMDFSDIEELARRLEMYFEKAKRGAVVMMETPPAELLNALEALIEGKPTPARAAPAPALQVVPNAPAPTPIESAVDARELQIPEPSEPADFQAPPPEGDPAPAPVVAAAPEEPVPAPEVAAAPQPEPLARRLDPNFDAQRQLIEIFQTEAKEHIERIRSLLSDLQQRPDDRELLDEAFRRAHSLKGGARVTELDTVEALTHRMESILDRIRSGTSAPTPEIWQALTKGIDAVEDWLAGLEANRMAPVPAELLQELDAMVSAPAPEPVEVAPEPPAQVVPEPPVEVVPEQAVEVMPEQPVEVVPEQPVEAAPVAEETPPAPVEVAPEPEPVPVPTPVSEPEPAPAAAATQAPAPVPTAEELLTKAAPPPPAEPAKPAGTILKPSAPAPRQPQAESAPAHPTDIVKVNISNLSPLYRQLLALLSESQRQDQLAKEVRQVADSVTTMQRQWDEMWKRVGPLLRRLSFDSDLSTAANYIDGVGQQIKTLRRKVQASALQAQRGAWSLKSLGQQMRLDIRRIFTVPVQSMYSNVRKMVRDVARECGKEIEFIVNGFDLEADRMVLQALRDPLMHVLTNAVYHGIESTEQRKAAGKPARGHIELTFQVMGNELSIRIEDDGRGMDFEKIRSTATKRGLLPSSEASKATPDELARIIFRPGFSTADTVSEIAGRGMGLSVVQQEVVRLQGKAEARPREGGGTVFEITVPLFVSTHKLILVKVGGHVFGVPFYGVHRLCRVKRGEMKDDGGKTTAIVDGAELRMTSLHDLLRIANQEDREVSDYVPTVVLKHRNRRLALEVDSFIGEKEGVIKDIGDPIRRIDAIAGGILLENGSVALVLDPGCLMDAVDGVKPIESLAMTESRPDDADDPKPKRILIVDDSLTTRTLEKSILEAYGYHVELAVDGIEALNRLHAEPFDIVVTDLEMPRMNGFELVAALKGDKKLRETPIIMVTSRDEPAERERGLALGADAYILKQKFDQHELLETLRQFLA